MALERLILSGGDAAGLMLIVDYAESRREDVVWLADRLMRRAETVARPARLVLLSRGNGVWWRELVLTTPSLQMLCSLGGDAYDEIAIPEEIPVRDRRALFDAAVTAFLPYRPALAPDAGKRGKSRDVFHGSWPGEVPAISKIGAPGASERDRRDMPGDDECTATTFAPVTNAGALRPPADDFWHRLDSEPDYARPLAVQIAALLHVADSEVAADRPGIAYLLDRILGLEYAHWGKTLPIYHKPNGKTAIHNGVAQVTLASGVASVAAAEALIERDPFYARARDIDVPGIRHDLALICPGNDDGLAGLEPDLIGEHHVADVAGDALVDACLAWSGEDRARRQHILTVLNRATRDEHGAKALRATDQLKRLLHTEAATLGGDLVKVALETPGRLLDLCPALAAELEALDEPALAAIDAELPLQSLALMELSLSVARRRADLARSFSAELLRTTPARSFFGAACTSILGTKIAARR